MRSGRATHCRSFSQFAACDRSTSQPLAVLRRRSPRSPSGKTKPQRVPRHRSATRVMEPSTWRANSSHTSASKRRSRNCPRIRACRSHTKSRTVTLRTWWQSRHSARCKPPSTHRSDWDPNDEVRCNYFRRARLIARTAARAPDTGCFLAKHRPDQHPSTRPCTSPQVSSRRYVGFAAVVWRRRAVCAA